MSARCEYPLRTPDDCDRTYCRLSGKCAEREASLPAPVPGSAAPQPDDRKALAEEAKRLALAAVLNAQDRPADRVADPLDLLSECRAIIDRLAAPAQTPASASSVPPKLMDFVLRDIFLAAGFTIKAGQTDLKPYVYSAGRCIEANVRSQFGIKE